ncbi:MAG: hypothetical protein ABIJ16_07405, partial [Bacteroidota bacterium]
DLTDLFEQYAKQFKICRIYKTSKEEDGERQRVITSEIVGKWWTKTATDSITHEYSTYGKMILMKYQGGVLKYTGNYDYDIEGDQMEYWGERMNGKTFFEIEWQDTLYLESFNNISYYLFRVIE